MTRSHISALGDLGKGEGAGEMTGMGDTKYYKMDCCDTNILNHEIVYFIRQLYRMQNVSSQLSHILNKTEKGPDLLQNTHKCIGLIPDYCQANYKLDQWCPV